MILTRATHVVSHSLALPCRRSVRCYSTNTGVIYAVNTAVEHDWPAHSEHQGKHYTASLHAWETAVTIYEHGPPTQSSVHKRNTGMKIEIVSAGRVVSAVAGLNDSGLAEHPQVRQLKYEPASRESIKLVHSPTYVDGLAEVINQMVRACHVSSLVPKRSVLDCEFTQYAGTLGSGGKWTHVRDSIFV